MTPLPSRSIASRSAAAGLTAVLALLPTSGAAQNYCYSAILGPRWCSPLDTPLRPYFVPRRPAWGGHDFRYRVEVPEPWEACGPPCDDGSERACLAVPPELPDRFEQWKFERLGQIPNDSLLETAAGTTR